MRSCPLLRAAGTPGWLLAHFPQQSSGQHTALLSCQVLAGLLSGSILNSSAVCSSKVEGPQLVMAPQQLPAQWHQPAAPPFWPPCPQPSTTPCWTCVWSRICGAPAPSLPAASIFVATLRRSGPWALTRWAWALAGGPAPAPPSRAQRAGQDRNLDVHKGGMAAGELGDRTGAGPALPLIVRVMARSAQLRQELVPRADKHRLALLHASCLRP